MSDTIDNPPPDACCSCDCGCTTPLTAGNAMSEDITHEMVQPWETVDADVIPVKLLICADCYTGSHGPRTTRT
jgi:hypothetical protein